MTKIPGSGSISQRHGSADPDPDRHQNDAMDQQHWDPDPYDFGPPGPGSVSQRYGSETFYHQEKKVRKTLIFTVM